jgi:hypothetical protein
MGPSYQPWGFMLRPGPEGWLLELGFRRSAGTVPREASRKTGPT